MVILSQTWNKLQPFQILVLGDFLLDMYTTGKVRRISPEAPVPVMEVLSQESRPGGAGNVVLNLQSLGAKVFCAGRVGADVHGEQLKSLLSIENVDQSALVVETGYTTPVKNRLIADSQQLLRVDFETITPLDRHLEEELIEKIANIIPQVQVVALSDYGKGFLTHRLISIVIDMARSAHVPVIVDPKGTDFAKYKGATIIKPNLSEAYAAAKKSPSAPLHQVASEIFASSAIDLLLITRSEAGMSLFDKEGNQTDFPVVSKEVKDVTGAGDTVLAVLCLAVANHLEMSSAVQLANIAAGIAIERLGCVQVTLSELAKRLLQVDNQTKIFNENHTYALKQVLKGKQYSLLVLAKGQQMTLAFFKQLRKLSKKESRELIIYVSDPEEEFVHFLSSLNEVDYILLQKESLKHLYESIQPHEVIFLEGDKLTVIDQAKDILQSLMQYPIQR